jgi:hypothetical protein
MKDQALSVDHRTGFLKLAGGRPRRKGTRAAPARAPDEGAGGREANRLRLFAASRNAGGIAQRLS